MCGVVRLDTASHRLVIFVEVNTDKNAFSDSIGECCTIRQRDIGVAYASHQCGDSFGVQEPVDSTRNIQGQIFFQHAAAHRAGVLTAVAGIKNNDCKWLGLS